MKKKRTKRILRYFLLLVVSAIIGINVFYTVSARIVGEALPMPFGFGVSVVLSGSMEGSRSGSLSVGDLILVKPMEEYRVGEVVVYQTGSSATVHRIIERNGDTVLTQGDANNAPDKPFDVSAIKGKVVFSLPFIGYLVLAVRKPIGTVVIIGLAVFLMERSFRREKKEKAERLEEIKAEIRQLMDEQENK